MITVSVLCISTVSKVVPLTSFVTEMRHQCHPQRWQQSVKCYVESKRVHALSVQAATDCVLILTFSSIPLPLPVSLPPPFQTSVTVLFVLGDPPPQKKKKQQTPPPPPPPKKAMQDNLDCTDLMVMIAEQLHVSSLTDVDWVSDPHVAVYYRCQTLPSVLLLVGWLVNFSATCEGYLRDGSAQTVVCAATLI